MRSKNYEDYHYTIFSIFRHICKATVKHSYHICHICLSALNDSALIGQIFMNFYSFILQPVLHQVHRLFQSGYTGIFTKACQLQSRLVKIKKSNTLLEQLHTSVSCQYRYSKAKETGNDLNIKIYNISSHVKNRNVMSTFNLQWRVVCLV